MRRANGVVVFLALASLLLGTNCSSPGSKSSPRTTIYPEIGGITVSPGQDPFHNGQNVTLAQAEEIVPFHVYRPNDPLASDANLTAVWVEESGQSEGINVFQVALQYETSVRIHLGTPTDNEVTDPRGFLESLGEGLEGASIQTVLSVPALVLPDSDSAPGSVVLILESVQVEVIGPYTIDDIIRVANTLS